MSPALRIHRPVQGHEALPADIYLPLVDSLFKDTRTFVSGNVFATVAIFTTYWKTGEIILLYCAMAIVLVACARGIVMRAYFRARSTVTSTGIARRWEHRYVAGATASTALLGFWCYAAFAWTPDPFAHLVSFSTTIGYAMGISGRNFGNIRFVIVQILCVAADDGGAFTLRKSVLLGLCRHSRPVLPGDKIHRGKISRHAAQCPDYIARYVVARNTI
jgi:hypothetical protein